jgi:hypothetical protein
MRRLALGLCTSLLLLALGQAQLVQQIVSTPAPVSGSGHTFTRNGTIGGTNSACTLATSSCAVTITGTIAAGDMLWVVFRGGATASTWITSVTGETATLCPSQACYNETASGSVDQAFVATAVGGETTITVNLNAAPAAAYLVGIYDFVYTGAGALALDGSAATNAATATTQTAPSISPTGTSDFYGQVAKVSVTSTIGVGAGTAVTNIAHASPNVVTTGTTPTNGELVTIAAASQANCNISGVVSTLVTLNTTFTYVNAGCSANATSATWYYGPYQMISATQTLGYAAYYTNAPSYTAPTWALNSTAAANMSTMAIK